MFNRKAKRIRELENEVDILRCALELRIERIQGLQWDIQRYFDSISELSKERCKLDIKCKDFKEKKEYIHRVTCAECNGRLDEWLVCQECGLKWGQLSG